MVMLGIKWEKEQMFSPGKQYSVFAEILGETSPITFIM